MNIVSVPYASLSNAVVKWRSVFKNIAGRWKCNAHE